MISESKSNSKSIKYFKSNSCLFKFFPFEIKFLSFIFFWIFGLVNLFSQTSKLTHYSSESLVWHETVGTLLSEPLWKTRDAYDAGHFLMIPLHHAFITADTTAIFEFSKFFKKMGRSEFPEGQLNQVHIIYLSSQYLFLKKRYGYQLNASDIFLVKRILKFIRIKWFLDVAFQWDQLPFFGLKNRLDFALENSLVKDEASYNRAITDYELFFFAIASDISFLTKNSSLLEVKDVEVLKNINLYLIRILNTRGTFTEYGGWVFQQGYWRDHSSYMYSGHLVLKEDLSIFKVENISEDSSHAHRWPLWISSFYHADADNENLLDKINNAFSMQFVLKIGVKNQNGVLMNNFIDGHNGLYRYKYITTGSGISLGYGPYNLSGTLGIAWYCFLDGTEEFYKLYKNSYPLNNEILKLYVGPNTTRTRNKLFKSPEFFTNGFAELIAQQAFEISYAFKLNDH